MIALPDAIREQFDAAVQDRSWEEEAMTRGVQTYAKILGLETEEIDNIIVDIRAQFRDFTQLLFSESTLDLKVKEFFEIPGLFQHYFYLLRYHLTSEQRGHIDSLLGQGIKIETAEALVQVLHEMGVDIFSLFLKLCLYGLQTIRRQTANNFVTAMRIKAQEVLSARHKNNNEVAVFEGTTGTGSLRKYVDDGGVLLSINEQALAETLIPRQGDLE